MSKLDEMIAELCPDGVKYCKVGDVCTTITDYTAAGSFADIAKNVKYISNGIGYAQLIRTTDLKSAFKKKDKFVYVDEHAYNYLWRVNLDSEALVLPNVGNCGEVYYITPDIFPLEHNVLGPNAILVKSNVVSIRFLYHLLLSKEFQNKLVKIISATGQTKFNKTNFKELTIPVPPLPVQSEIVRILDNFTVLTAELTAELTTELTARKKQYEYYRDELFGKDYDEMLKRCLQNNVKVITLNELGNFSRGKRFVRSDIREKGTPCIHYGDLYTYYGISAEKSKCFLDGEFSKKMRLAHKGDVVIVQAGENDMDIGIGVAWLGDEDVAVHDACYIFKHNINPKYISHYLRTNIYHLQIKKYVSTGKICSISAQNIGKALIPVPPLAEQERIVGILDRFDVLFKDISTRLPAEIEARIKQYEYYRDKLLTFKELS